MYFKPVRIAFGRKYNICIPEWFSCWPGAELILESHPQGLKLSVVECSSTTRYATEGTSIVPCSNPEDTFPDLFNGFNPFEMSSSHEGNFFEAEQSFTPEPLLVVSSPASPPEDLMHTSSVDSPSSGTFTAPTTPNTPSPVSSPSTSHYEKSSEMLPCRNSGCDRVFKRNQWRLRHEMSHNAIQCTFPNCRTKFKRNHDSTTKRMEYFETRENGPDTSNALKYTFQ
ncbi:hypothetical protein DL96DRAFT_1562759 [Flagelloscypha sp. PMI_526]|nr:hypothetical protein DL96DRAFT_1562759 [Flagelloscypha sp. PMI_526]